MIQGIKTFLKSRKAAQTADPLSSAETIMSIEYKKVDLKICHTDMLLDGHGANGAFQSN